jgi:hypothetical protein
LLYLSNGKGWQVTNVFDIDGVTHKRTPSEKQKEALKKAREIREESRYFADECKHYDNHGIHGAHGYDMKKLGKEIEEKGKKLGIL